MALLGALAALLPHPALADPGYRLLSNPQMADRTRARSPQSTRPSVFQPGTLGLCQFYNLSGYFAINPTGGVVPLQPYCQGQQNWVWYAEGDFWQAFRRAAPEEAIEFAQTLNQQAIEAYAQSICTLLNDETLTPATATQTLQIVQADSTIPAEFDQAVTQAAIHAHCPDHPSTQPNQTP